MSLLFDATQFDPTLGYEPLPAGTYSVRISDTEMVNEDASNNFGQQRQSLAVSFEVVEGQQKGRIHTERLLLSGTDNDAIRLKISQNTLSAICHAVGVFHLTQPSDPRLAAAELRDKFLQLELTLTPSKKDPNVFYNNVRSVMDTQGNKPGRQHMGGGTKAASAPVASAAPTAPSAPTPPLPSKIAEPEASKVPYPHEQTAPENVQNDPWGQQAPDPDGPPVAPKWG